MVGWGGLGWVGVLTFCPRKTFKYVTHFSNHVHGVGYSGSVHEELPSTLLTCNYVAGSSNITCNYVVVFFSKLQLRCYLLLQIATTLLALLTSLATTLLSSSPNCNYVVGSSKITRNYVGFFFFKSQLHCWLFGHHLQLRCYLLSLKLQLLCWLF